MAGPAVKGRQTLATNPMLFWEIFTATGSPTAYIMYRNCLEDCDS
jgi:hypothetical protein